MSCFENLQRALVQFRVGAAGIERGHAANGVSAVLVANFRHQGAEVLEEGHVVRDGVAIGQNPVGIFEHEIDQRGHVIPAAEVQSQAVVAQIEKKFLHLIGQRVRLHQRHAFDVVLRQALLFGENLEEIAPPEGFLGRLALGDVHGEIVRQPRGIDLIPDQSQIEQGSGHDFVLDTPPWLRCSPRGRTQVTVFERCTVTFFCRFLSS